MTDRDGREVYRPSEVAVAEVYIDDLEAVEDPGWM